MDSSLRLSELVATLALAQDNAFGQPLESQLRSCLLATWMCDEAACAAMTPGPPVVAVAALSELALVLAGLAATQSAPSSSGSRTTPESPRSMRESR